MDHPTHWEFPPELDTSVPWVGSLKALYEHPVSFPASMSPACGALLRSIVANHRPRRALEIGCFVGVSTHWIASAMTEPDAHLWSFDDFGPIEPGPWRKGGLDVDRQSFVARALERAGLDDRVTLVRGNSSEWVTRSQPELREAGGIDLALIDGDHTNRGVKRDFLAVEPILNTGGLVILHDTFPAQCGHHGPRSLIDNLHLWTAGVKHRVGLDLPAPFVAEGASVIGEGLYEKAEFYLSPLNYGLAVLRRIG
ncbi:MAG: class I SAM-dependent methyltransferase [Planctomycetota bacterium]